MDFCFEQKKARCGTAGFEGSVSGPELFAL